VPANPEEHAGAESRLMVWGCFRPKAPSFEEKMAAFLLVPQRACKVTLNGLMRFNVVA
jgi:hypothetical protein